MILLRLVSRRWLLTSLLVIAALAVLVRLGIWQVDRLEQRRAFNARVLARVNQEPLQLGESTIGENLVNMEYRPVVVTGEYDFSQEVVIRNQVWRDQIGVHLLTPLHIQGTDQTVLVDRGWIPIEDFTAGKWEKYAERGQVTVRGAIRISQSKPDFGRVADPTPQPGQRMIAWNFVNLEAMSKQLTTPILPVYIQQSPDPSWTQLPYRSVPDLDLTEGPHLSYAIQWFSFALILAVGYPYYVHREDLKAQNNPFEKITGEPQRINKEA